MNIYQFILEVYDIFPINFFFFFIFIITFLLIVFGIRTLYKQVIIEFLIPKLWKTSKFGNAEFLPPSPAEEAASKLWIEHFQKKVNEKGNQHA